MGIFMCLFTAYLTSLCKTKKSLSDQMTKSNGKPVMNKNPKMNEIKGISPLSVAITPIKSPNGLVAQKIKKLVMHVNL